MDKLRDFVAFGIHKLQFVLCLACCPEGFLHLHIGLYFGALAMLCAILPHAVVAATVCPHVHAEPILLIILVFALVATAIGPRVDATSMHLTILPLALVRGLARWVGQLAVAMEKIGLEAALVYASILTYLFASWTFLTSLKHAVVLPSIRSDLYTLTVWLIIHEFTLDAYKDVSSSVLLGHLALATGLTIQVVAFDDSACAQVCLNSLTLRVASNEAALIFVTIGPLYLTLAIRDVFFLAFSDVSANLACVDSTIL